MNSPSYDRLLSELMELDNFEAIVDKCLAKDISIGADNMDFVKELMAHKDHALDFIDGFLAKKTVTDTIGLKLTAKEEELFYRAGADSERLVQGLVILDNNQIAQFEEWRASLFKNPSTAPEIAKALSYLIAKESINVGYLYQERLAESRVPMAEAFQIVREERHQLKQAIEILSNIGSYTSLRRLLQRYATENLGERLDKDLLLNKIAAVADFYERQPAQRTWMESVAGTYTEACVNQPTYGMMLLETGIRLANARSPEEQHKAASFLYILHQAHAVIEKDHSILSSLKAEATNLLVRQTYAAMKESFGSFLVFEKSIVNAQYLPAQQKEYIENRSQELAKQTQLLTREGLKDFLMSDGALESRQVWAGALFPQMVAKIKYEFEQRGKVLIDWYESLDSGARISELQRTVGSKWAPLLEEAARQPTTEAQKDFLYKQYTLNSITQETFIYHNIAQETARIFTPETQKTRHSLFENELSARRDDVLGRKQYR